MGHLAFEVLFGPNVHIQPRGVLRINSGWMDSEDDTKGDIEPATE